jgi:hypothetical protein
MPKNGLRLQTEAGDSFDLIAYKFPESRDKFNVFVNGARTQAARTHGIGKQGDPRCYTYIKFRGTSMYVTGWLDPDSHVTVSSAR